MHEKAYIIGKNQSAKQHINFNPADVDSFGLNQAAIWYNTKWAITGHESVYNELIKAGLGNIILPDPLFEGKSINNLVHIDSIRHKKGFYALNFQETPDHEIEYLIANAAEGRDIHYDNYYTILHICLYYCIKKGYREIDLFGCNNTYPEKPSDKHLADYMRLHTGKMIEIAKKYAITINWIL